jgi:hypothetical protein
MRRRDETDLEYWARRQGEAMEMADRADGPLREAHLALAASYTRLIEITSGHPVEPGADGND